MGVHVSPVQMASNPVYRKPWNKKMKITSTMKYTNKDQAKILYLHKRQYCKGNSPLVLYYNVW